MKRYKDKFKEGSNYKYYYEEFMKVLRGADTTYAPKIKISSDKKETKWLDMNEDCMDAFKKAVEDSGYSKSHLGLS